MQCQCGGELKLVAAPRVQLWWREPAGAESPYPRWIMAGFFESTDEARQYIPPGVREDPALYELVPVKVLRYAAAGVV